jgi:hypothetical protein
MLYSPRAYITTIIVSVREHWASVFGFQELDQGNRKSAVRSRKTLSATMLSSGCSYFTLGGGGAALNIYALKGK